MLYNLPIESLEERYSAQWNIGFPGEYNRLGVRFTTVYPGGLGGDAANTITRGQFLDVVRTNEFKSLQMAQMMWYFDRANVQDNDVIFLHDLWNPCLEMLFYVRNGLGINFKIAGMLHAGTYDPHDFLTQRGMAQWAAPIEAAWLSEVDLVFVATQYHRDLLLSSRAVPADHIVVSGFPLFQRPHVIPPSDKENIVVFPHRLAPEKGIDVFDELKTALWARLPGWKFVRTKDACKNKKEYYDLLWRSKVAVSCALQETWGIAQQEALFHRCIPVVPYRLSYKELYPRLYQYETTALAAEKLVYFAENYDWMVRDTPFLDTVDICYQKSRMAVPTMIYTMRERGWHA